MQQILSIEELIELKCFIENQKEYLVISFKDGKPVDKRIEYSELELLEKLNTDKGVTALAKSFQQLITFFSSESIPIPTETGVNYQEGPKYQYDELIIKTNFGLLITKDNYDETNEKILDKSKILKDIVYVDFCEYILKNNNTEIPIEPESSPKYTGDAIFIVSFNDFVIGLNKLGFQLETISNFNDLKQNSTTEVKITFPKQKKLTKSQNNYTKTVK